jgi:hypothetical protein
MIGLRFSELWQCLENDYGRARRMPRRIERRGSVLVEFAMVSLVMYLLLAASIEFGRIYYSVNLLQGAANTLASAIQASAQPSASAPNGNKLAPNLSGAQALQDPIIAPLFDSQFLVVTESQLAGQTPYEFFVSGSNPKPLINRLLFPLMIFKTVDGQQVLTYPGAFDDGTGVWKVPVVSRASGEEQLVSPVPVVSVSTKTVGALVTVSVEMNYPYQAATLTAFAPSPNGPFEPNGSSPIEVPGGASGNPGAYGGPDGLGEQYALGRAVRPYRKVLNVSAGAAYPP